MTVLLLPFEFRCLLLLSCLISLDWTSSLVKGLFILYTPGKCSKMFWKLVVLLELTFPVGVTLASGDCHCEAMCQPQGGAMQSK